MMLSIATRKNRTVVMQRILSCLAIASWAVLPSACAATPTGGGEALQFDRYLLETGKAERQTVVSGFFLDRESAELAVVSTDRSGNRHLRLFGMQGEAWVPVLESALRSDLRFVDVAVIAGQDRLITYGDSGLRWFDPESASEQPLAAIDWHFRAEHPLDVPQLDISQDLNGDGRDDLVLPAMDGFWVLLQTRAGEFTAPVKLGPAEPFLAETALESKHRYGTIGITAQTLPWYLSRVHAVDFDADGRSDLVFWNQDHFAAYLQNDSGGFNETPLNIATDVQFESDGMYSLIFGFNDESTFALMSGFRKRSTRSVLHSVRDLNGDSVADLVVLSMQGRSLLNQRSAYRLHFGTVEAGVIRHSAEPDSLLQAQGRAAGLMPFGYSSLWMQDVDADGRIEMMLAEVPLGVGKMLRVLFSNTISLNLEFFRMDGEHYAEQPTATHAIRPAFERLSGREPPFFPAVLAGDVDGDGRSDLLVGAARNQLQIMRGIAGPTLFAEQAQTFDLQMPNHEQDMRLIDVNRDGKQDLLVLYPSSAEAHRLAVLIAR